MIEYILIKNINASEAHAHELGQLLSSRRKHILLNLIPYNPTDVCEAYEPPTQVFILLLLLELRAFYVT
jgi:adenine C2-methylase RlmN of 23S rRNA A2503 and tRNA A37